MNNENLSFMFTISKATHRMSKNWVKEHLTWGDMIERLKTPTKTEETVAEYRKMSKSDRAAIKDIGGFVGGTLSGKRRKRETVVSRSLVTLDIDNGDLQVYENIRLALQGCAFAVYSTHSHTKEEPRLRVIIPLSREVSPDEYEALSRAIGDNIGLHYMDRSTFEPSRLMYWPSYSSDGDYYFESSSGEVGFLDPDVLLEDFYLDWTDTSEWPGISEEESEMRKGVCKLSDPRDKTGLVGAFCRAFSVSDAIDIFLPDVYIPGKTEGRYTYANGSSADGLVIYDDTFAYSHHATDPIGDGHEYNAYDLVRIHKFGREKQSEREMRELCLGREEVRLELGKMLGLGDLGEEDGENTHENNDTEEKTEEGDKDREVSLEWLNSLEYTKQGQLEKSLNNLIKILENDPNLKSIQFNEMSFRPDVKGAVPWKRSEYTSGWRDADDAQLQAYLARNYTEFPKSVYTVAFDKVVDDRRFHPIQDYFNELDPWDGIERVDELFIKCLNAEDSAYVRAVTHKTLVAAVARVMEPGCKFDYMLVLNGPQGIGKSSLIARLAKKWFSDSLRLQDTRDKTAAEKLNTAWIHEFGELAGLGKIDSSTLKSFLSASADDYRPSYGRQVIHRKRQCIFFGSTNAEEGFLRDETGGRRFWPVEVHGEPGVVKWKLSEDDIDKIWAEAYYYYKTEGVNSLHLEGEVLKAAQEQQRESLEADPREEMVRAYLDMLVPKEWDRMSKEDRENFINGLSNVAEDELVPVEHVSYEMIWRECFREKESRLDNKGRAEIKRILDRIGWVRSDKWARFYGERTRARYFERA